MKHALFLPTRTAKPIPHDHSASSTDREMTLPNVTLNSLVEHVTTTQWYKLGLALGMDDSVLQFIKGNTKGDVETGLMLMFQKWLSSCEQPSWDNVIQALRKIRENRLAAEICRKF